MHSVRLGSSKISLSAMLEAVRATSSLFEVTSALQILISVYNDRSTSAEDRPLLMSLLLRKQRQLAAEALELLERLEQLQDNTEPPTRPQNTDTSSA